MPWTEYLEVTNTTELLRAQAEGLCRLERPAPTDPNLVKHRMRYAFAMPLTLRATVVDAACGTGYGTVEYGARASRVHGFDIAPRAIALAQELPRAGNVEFAVADATRLPLPGGYADLFTSFETIEHVPEPRALLREIRRVLRPGGVAVLSTPNKRFSTPDRSRPYNEFHLVEWEPVAFLELLRQEFPDVVVHGQVRIHDARAVQESAIRYFAQDAGSPNALRSFAGRIASALGVKQALRRAASYVLPRPEPGWVPFLWGEQRFATEAEMQQAFAVERTDSPEDYLVTVAVCRG